jgi:hypothetical protein
MIFQRLWVGFRLLCSTFHIVISFFANILAWPSMVMDCRLSRAVLGGWWLVVGTGNDKKGGRTTRYAGLQLNRGDR